MRFTMVHREGGERFHLPGRHGVSRGAVRMLAMTHPHLSPRQIELFRLLATGLTMRSAAAAMHVAINTAYNLRTEAFERLNVASLPEAWTVLGWLKVPEEAAA